MNQRKVKRLKRRLSKRSSKALVARQEFNQLNDSDVEEDAQSLLRVSSSIDDDEVDVHDAEKDSDYESLGQDSVLNTTAETECSDSSTSAAQENEC